jgi:hypothetical protein
VQQAGMVEAQRQACAAEDRTTEGETVTSIFAIDPGTKQSGWVMFEGGMSVKSSGVSPNAELLARIQGIGGYAMARMIAPVRLAVERFEARGMPIGDESIETLLWTGRFIQAWHTPDEVILVKRSAVKLSLCGTARAKDPNVRQALIDAIGAPGTKKAPGPTYGVTSHAWAALAVAKVAAL